MLDHRTDESATATSFAFFRESHRYTWYKKNKILRSGKELVDKCTYIHSRQKPEMGSGCRAHRFMRTDVELQPRQREQQQRLYLFG